MTAPTSAQAETLQQLYRTGDAVRASGLTAETSEPLFRRYIDFVRSFCPGGKVLDVGCGAGWSAHWFAAHGHDVIGVDLNPRAFEPPPSDRLRFVPGSAMDLPFPDGAFDVAASNQCLEHVPNPARMLTEMLRVVRPGGIVCVVGPNLLGLSPGLAALFWHVWRNRPIRRIFVRGPGMPRHPYGNTVPEVTWNLGHHLFLTVCKAISAEPTFTMRAPDLTPPFHADNDAVYLCNPLDLVRHFRRRGCTVLRSTAAGRPEWMRMLAGGTWVAVRTPDSSKTSSGV
jgi:SAM-dependent methyltransferase